MTSEPTHAVRVLVADEPGDALHAITRTLTELGHEVVARQSPLEQVGRITALEHPDVAVVMVRDATTRALTAIDRIVHEATCPVIAVLDVEDRNFINEAAKRGIFAYLTAEDDPQMMQSAFDIVLRRFAEYHNLEGAFGRRAVTERAKGILMERHGLDEEAAYQMLRDQARRTNEKLVDLAEAVVRGHPILPARAKPSPGQTGEP